MCKTKCPDSIVICYQHYRSYNVYHYVALISLYIALLNVRSISAKLVDINNDDMLKYASVLCFCETWLSPSQPSPVLHDNHVVFRSDRVSHDNKGGVMISVHENMRPAGLHPPLITRSRR